MKCFAKVVKSYYAKCSIFDVWQGCEYASEDNFFKYNKPAMYHGCILLPLIIHEKPGNGKIDCGDRIWKKPCFFTFSNRLWQLVVWHLYQFLYISLFTMECFCSSSLCYNNLCTKLAQVIKSNTTGFLTIPGQNRKTLKVKRIQAKDN